MAKAKEARMKNKKLLAIVLLSLSFCFVSGVGYGTEMRIEEIREAKNIIKYITTNPRIFLYVY